MNKKIVKKINESVTKYGVELGNLNRDEWNHKFDSDWKKIRMDYNFTTSNAYSDLCLGTRRNHLNLDRPSLNDTSLRPTKEAYESIMTEEAVKLVSGYIALYLAAEERLSKRTFWDKVFHPVLTYRENKSFNELKESMEHQGITEDMVNEYEEASEKPILIDDAVKENISLDIEEDKKTEIFVNRNFEAKVEEIYLV